MCRYFQHMVDHRQNANDRDRAAFPGDPAGVAAMRAWLRRRVADNPRRDDIELVATELAANAVGHTASSDFMFAVRLDRADTALHLAVQDLGGDDKPQPIDTDPDTKRLREHGYGLTLVDALADTWGATGDGFGRDVWAAFHLTGHETAPSGNGDHR